MPISLRCFSILRGPNKFHRVNFAQFHYTIKMQNDGDQTTQVTQNSQKRHWKQSQSGENHGRVKKIKTANAKKKAVGIDDVLIHDVMKLLKSQKLEEVKKSDLQIANENNSSTCVSQVNLPKTFTEIDVEVKEISSTGDGLAVHPESKRVFVVPFSVPGDKIRAKVIRHFEEENYSTADLVSVIKGGPNRDDSRINCKYFGICSGCQFQMLDYDTQLRHKKTVIERAYKNFSHIPDELVPPVGYTIGSPLLYGYRTKLTPHFDAPKGKISKADKLKGLKNHFKETPKIGFNAKGANYTLDIEDCPIGTDAVRMGMKRERLRVAENLERYTSGATILLRENTLRLPNNEINIATIIPDTIKTIGSDHIDFKSCTTDNRAKTTEYIENFKFTNIANEFFQNNNSILPRFTQYIRQNILPPGQTHAKVKNLIDAYSGSGLFTITLSSLFENSLGIDISVASIKTAEENALQNNLAPPRTRFIAADASQLFKEITFNPDETALIIDPSRKGCDEAFINQLLNFSPRRIVYVSCNVHTQARDVGKIINGLADDKDKKCKEESKYIIESLVGFDFFPQTSHVESVAILDRVGKNVNY